MHRERASRGEIRQRCHRRPDVVAGSFDLREKRERGKERGGGREREEREGGARKRERRRGRDREREGERGSERQIERQLHTEREIMSYTQVLNLTETGKVLGTTSCVLIPTASSQNSFLDKLPPSHHSGCRHFAVNHKSHRSEILPTARLFVILPFGCITVSLTTPCICPLYKTPLPPFEGRRCR